MFRNLQIDVSELPDAALLEYEKLDRKYIRVMRVGSIISWLFGLLSLWILFYAVDEPTHLKTLFVAVSVAFLICLIGNQLILKPALDYRGFAIREHDLSYRRGIVKSRITTIPYRRIQQVAISQNILERPLKLYSITIHNASDATSNMTIRGLSRERAERIRTYILDHIVHDEAV